MMLGLLWLGVSLAAEMTRHYSQIEPIESVLTGLKSGIEDWGDCGPVCNQNDGAACFECVAPHLLSNSEWNPALARYATLRAINYFSERKVELLWKFLDHGDLSFLRYHIDYAPSWNAPVLTEYFQKYRLSHAPPFLNAKLLVAFKQLQNYKDFQKVMNYAAPLLSEYGLGHPRWKDLKLDLSDPLPVVQVNLLCLIQLLPANEVTLKFEDSPLLPTVSVLSMLEEVCTEHGVDLKAWIDRVKLDKYYALVRATGKVEDEVADSVFAYLHWPEKPRPFNLGEATGDCLRLLLKKAPARFPTYLVNLKMGVLTAIMWEIPEAIPFMPPLVETPIDYLIPRGKVYSLEKSAYFQAILTNFGVEGLRDAMMECSDAYSGNDFFYLGLFSGITIGWDPTGLLGKDLKEEDRLAWWMGRLSIKYPFNVRDMEIPDELKALLAQRMSELQ